LLSKTLADNEKQIMQLKEELIEANTLRKQQIVELGILREDERQKLVQEYETQILIIKQEYDQIQQNRKGFFEQQMAQQDERNQTQSKIIEKDFDERTQRQNTLIKDLQKNLQDVKDENKKTKEIYENEFNNLLIKFDEERNSIKKHYSNSIAVSCWVICCQNILSVGLLFFADSSNSNRK
jgi:centrosomal protein CEP112